MQPERHIPLWAKLLAATSIVIIAGVLTVLALKVVTPKTQVAVSAQEAVAQFSQKAPQYLEAAGYQKATTPTNNLVYNNASGHSYALYVTASQYVQYNRKDTSVQTNNSQAVAAYHTLLTGLGFTQVSTSGSGVYATVLYQGSKAVCQIDDYQKIGDIAASYGLACIDISGLDQAYKDTSALLDKASADLPLAKIASVRLSTVAESGAQLSILVTKNTDSTSSTLYLLNTNSGWKYLGCRPTPSVDDAASYTVPDSLTQAINNSAQKAFLNRVILGT